MTDICNRLPDLEKEFIEKLAELEHEQWMEWSAPILMNEDISLSRRRRWEQCRVPYCELSEEMKESDRTWAKKVFQLVKRYVDD